MRKGLRTNIVAISGFWIVIALFLTVVMWAVHPVSFRPFDWQSETVWELSFAVVWVVSTNFVFYLAGKFPLTSSSRIRNGAIHFLIGLLLAGAQCVAHGLLVYAFSNNRPSSLFNGILVSLYLNVDRMIFVYWAIVILSSAVEFYRLFEQKELKASQLEAQLAQAQVLALKMQLQPHFLFNTLNAIVTLIQTNADLAEEMTVRLSNFLRLTLDASGKQLISLREELSFVKAYLEIEEVRFNGKLKYDEQITPSLLNVEVPALILQPLVENAIKHGISRFSSSSVVRVTAEQSDGNLLLTVKDDGMPAELIPASLEKNGVGLTNTRSRLATLYGENASLLITSNDARGLSVSVKIPFSNISP